MGESHIFDSDSPLFGYTDSVSDSEIRAAIYARTSSPNQRKGRSLDEQIRQCRRRCEARSWTVAYIYRDEAKSGKDNDRPMFQEMLTKAKLDAFDVVVVWKLDRFSRSLMHTVTLENQLREEDVALNSVTEQIDTTTPAGRFNFRNIASAAEFERDMIGQRTEMGLHALAVERKWPNDHPPLGYKKTKDERLQVLDEESKVVRWIFRQYLRRRSMPQVAHELNQNGSTTKINNEWTPRAVGDILSNEIYVGKYSVADVDAEIEEYQIVQDRIFEKVTEIRHRFQAKDSATRNNMPSERRERHVNKILSSYLSYLKNRDE